MEQNDAASFDFCYNIVISTTTTGNDDSVRRSSASRQQHCCAKFTLMRMILIFCLVTDCVAKPAVVRSKLNRLRRSNDNDREEAERRQESAAVVDDGGETMIRYQRLQLDEESGTSNNGSNNVDKKVDLLLKRTEGFQEFQKQVNEQLLLAGHDVDIPELAEHSLQRDDPGQLIQISATVHHQSSSANNVNINNIDNNNNNHNRQDGSRTSAAAGGHRKKSSHHHNHKLRHHHRNSRIKFAHSHNLNGFVEDETSSSLIDPNLDYLSEHGGQKKFGDGPSAQSGQQATSHFISSPYECPRVNGRAAQLLCPSRRRHGYHVCIDESALCNGHYDCPNGEDENAVNCMFYKTTMRYFKTVVDQVVELSEHVLEQSRRQSRNAEEL